MTAIGGRRPRLSLLTTPVVSALERARHAKHVLGDKRKDQVGRDRRHLIQAGLAELAFDVVFAGEPEAAVGLQAGVGRLP